MNKYKDYGFRIGRAFNQKVPRSVDEYLETALKTHDYLESIKVQHESGVYWAIPGNDAGNSTLFGGSGGVLFFYLELYKVTGDQKYLEIVHSGTDFIDKNWKKTINEAKAVMLANGITADTGVEYNYYMGVAGVGEGLITIYNALKREQELDTIREITEYILDGVKNDADGIHWGTDCSMFYDSGIMLYLYHASELIKDERILTTANKIADTIVSKAIKDERGGFAWTSTLHAGVDRVPNFEGGTAGVGYALAAAYKYNQKESCLNAAIESAKHIKAIAVKQGEGFLIPWHDEPGKEPIFYVSNCHGPAGTSKLFYKLYELTKNNQYLEDIKGLYRGLRFLGVPEKMSAGYWNSVCVCCGTAGVLQFLINCGIIFEREEIAEDIIKTAKLAANILLGEQEKKIGGRYGVWPIAYERIKPENIAPEYSYLTGAVGIAAALLQTYLFLKNDFEWIRFIDDPYPATFKTGID